MSRIKIRVSAGVFEVSLIRVIEETGSVEVLWDQNTKREFKWGSIVFGNTDTPIEQKPGECGPSRPPSTSTTRLSHAIDSTRSVLASSVVSMTPTSTDIIPPTNAPLPSNQASSTTPASVSTNLKPIYGQMTYPFAGALTYGQWATGSTPYGVAAQQPSYPYACFGGATTTTFVPQRQSYGQLSFAQIYGQSQAPPHGDQMETLSLSTATKTDTTPLQQNTTAVNSTQSSAQCNQPNAISLDTNVTSTTSAPASGAQDVSMLQAAQLADILRANPQLANIVLAAMGQAGQVQHP